MGDVESNVFESENRAVVYLDLLGFAALVEANPRYFVTDPVDRATSACWPTNLAARRLSLFNQVLESNISSEQPNHAMVFSDCAFGVFYTPTACADFAVTLMQGFLRAKVPVRMGLGFGTFRTLGTTSTFRDASTVVRAMFGGTSIVRAVAAETCGGKGMRIFAHGSFSEVFDVTRIGERRRKLLPVPAQLGAVSCELEYVSETGPERVDDWVANIHEMARSAPTEVQDHYSQTLAALSRMLGYDVDNIARGFEE